MLDCQQTHDQLDRALGKLVDGHGVHATEVEDCREWEKRSTGILGVNMHAVHRYGHVSAATTVDLMRTDPDPERPAFLAITAACEVGVLIGLECAVDALDPETIQAIGRRAYTQNEHTGALADTFEVSPALAEVAAIAYAMGRTDK